MTNAQETLQARYRKGYKVEEINLEAVAQMVGPAATKTQAEREAVVSKLHAMIERGEMAGRQTLETMAAAADQIAAIG